MHIYAFCMHNHKLQHAFLLLLLLEVFLAMNAKKYFSFLMIRREIFLHIFRIIFFVDNKSHPTMFWPKPNHDSNPSQTMTLTACPVGRAFYLT